jgi:hypothetical protein
VDVLNYKTPIYSQVSSKGPWTVSQSSRRNADHRFQWPMVGLIGIIFVFLPESPWWLASKGKLDKARRVLQFCNGGVDGYDIEEQIVSIS